MPQPPNRMLHGVAVPDDMFTFISGLAEEFAKSCPNDDAIHAYVNAAVEYAKCSAETFRALMVEVAYELTMKSGFKWTGPKPGRQAYSMGHPNYVHHKMSAQQRKARSEAYRVRNNIPKGFVRVYGVDVPQKLAKELRYIVVRRIKPDTLKYANPLRCIPRDLAEEFTTEALRRLVTNQDVSDEAMLGVAKDIVLAHGRPWKLKRKRP